MALAESSVDPARWRHPLYRVKISGLFEVTISPLISVYSRRAFKSQRYQLF